MKVFNSIISLFVFLLLLSGCDSKKDEISADMFAIPKHMSEAENKEPFKGTFTLTTTKNESFDMEINEKGLVSKELDGKIVLLNFFATWCPPCLKEIPAFVEVKEKYKDKFEIVAVLFSDDVSKEGLEKFMEEQKMNFKVIVGDTNNDLANIFGVKKIPESFIFGPDGTFLKKYVGETKKEDLEKDIEAILKHNQKEG